ncbi:uncharacterized protein LOC130748379 [Lotus japonicus]|uniref:uncharacterized protein LOC130748379 n=1 Tax=Lotus japonicus TaxID=34305 RepID=UPI002582ED7E|nr:uncharacterized protein LOC130748379 [Lotus japonicus]
MPVDPAAAAATTTTASRPISPLPHPHPHAHHHHHYQSPPQQQQTLPIRAPNPQFPKPHDPSSHHYLYPFASSARGGGPFVAKGFGPLPADPTVSGYPPPPPPSLMYSHGVRGMHLDYLTHALHMNRPPHLPYPHTGHAPPASTASPPVKGHTKATARSAASDVNGHKDTSTRERSRDETFVVIRDRKVRLTENASLYALCRSWLRNGIIEESQPQQKEVMKALPKPLPASMVASHMSNKNEHEKDDEQEESEEIRILQETGMLSSAEEVTKRHMKLEQSVMHLSVKDLFKRHIKRAKGVRARLREERLQRIKRYRSRLRLLLPPPVEQFRNDTAAGY